MTVQDENRKLGGDDRAAGVNPDHAPKLLEGKAVAWVSEWQGIGGPSRLFHYSEQDAIDSAAWMEGRCYPLYAHPAPIEAGLREADAKWLVGWLSREKDGGHCGEGVFERRERASWNERIDRILSALQSEGRQP